MGVAGALEDVWMSTREAAEYLGMSETHFRRSVLPAMKKMKIKGMGRLGNSANSSWRFKRSALDEFMAQNAVKEESGEG